MRKRIMEEVFISDISIKGARNVKDLSIKFPNNERKHLILTGKNGCGKTSLLIELNKFLNHVFNNQLSSRQAYINNIDRFHRQLEQLNSAQHNQKNKSQIAKLKQQITNQKQALENFGKAVVKFSNEHLLWERVKDGKFIMAYFDAKRLTSV